MSVSNNVNIAKVCVSLTIKAVAQGLEKDLKYPRKLYCTYQVVNDINTDDSSNSSLPKISNYLYALSGGYAFQAQNILNLGGGGIVATTPAGGGLTPFPISHVVTVGESGSMTLSSTDWVGLQDINQVTINQNVFQIGVQFTFSPLSGLFNFSLTGYTLQTNDIMTSFGFKPV